MATTIAAALPERLAVETDAAGDIRSEARSGRVWALAAGNALLSVVTLGIYSFWGRARVRRYLWGTTSFRGEPFDYAGTGGELFRGALMHPRPQRPGPARAALGGADVSTAALDAGAGLTALASSRAMERQADGWALRLMARADVSTAGLAGFMRRIADGGHGGSGFTLLATHPAPEERLALLAAAPVPEAPLRPLDDRGWRDLRTICTRLEAIAQAVRAGQ